MADVELSVVLVNHNGKDCLPQALGALARNTVAETREAIVVDSGSRDESWREVSRIWDRARAVRFEENIGFCAGCNRGAEAASGRFLAFVNFDGEVEPGWDAPLRALLEQEGIAVATGILVHPDGTTLEAAGLEIAPNMATYGRDEGRPRSSLPPGPVDVPAASGALMMVRRAEFLALGGFYEPIFMYGEEADYCLRVAGRIVLHPESAIRHRHGSAAGPARSATRLYWGSRNRLLNAARHLPAAALARSVLASAAFDVVTVAQQRSRCAVGAVLRGWWAAFGLVVPARRTTTPAERRRAAARLGSFRQALAQQRRLGRL